MTFEELQQLYDRIVLGYEIIEDKGKLYKVYDARPYHRIIAQREYEKAYAGFLSSGALSLAETECILQERGLWTDELQEKLEELEKQSSYLYEQMSLCEFQSKKKAHFKAQIDIITIKISKLKERRAASVTHTAEHLARVESYKTLIFLLTYHNDKRLWETREEFEKCDDDFVHKVMNKVFFNKDFTEKNIRKLARSEPWRSTWVAACKIGRLFDEPMSEMTDLQKALISWSLLYDNIFENPECPDDSVIQNDDLLDIWLKEQRNKREKEKGEHSAASIISRNSKINNAQEIGILVDSEEDAKRVYELNDAMARQRLRARTRMIDEKGKVREVNLPDVRQDLQMEINNMARNKVMK